MPVYHAKEPRNGKEAGFVSMQGSVVQSYIDAHATSGLDTSISNESSPAGDVFILDVGTIALAVMETNRRGGSGFRARFSGSQS